MEEKFVVAGIDMSGNIPKLAYWCKGAGEPQIFEEEADEIFSNDIVDIMERALSKLGAPGFLSVSIAAVAAASRLTETVMCNIVASINEAYPDTKITFISRGESVAHYSINQKKELRVNDVAFFDLDEAGLLYNRFHTLSANGRLNVLVESRDCSDTINLGCLEKEAAEAMDERFKNLINELFEKQHISTVYLTGKGFVNEEWAKDSLNMLCNKRRVFKGQSLYAIGACYYSAWGYFSEVNDDCRIVCEGRTAYETCLEVIYKEEKREAVLIPAGKLCHELGTITVEGIIAGETAGLTFIKRALFGKEVIREVIELDGLNDFKDRMLRVVAELRIVNGRELMVSIEDVGFGEFAKKTGVRVEKIIGNA